MLYLLGQKVPEDMDGRVLTEAFDPQYLKQHSADYAASSESPSPSDENASYSAEEAAQIEARLKALGYIE